MTATATILTPTSASGAIGVIEITARSGPELDSALTSLGVGALPAGTAALRSIAGIDRGVAARWTDAVCHLMPHGGIGVMRSLLLKLTQIGVSHQTQHSHFPEAGSPIENRMLATLAHAASPLAIDLLLDQPRRWSTGLPSDSGLDLVLNRLLDPPLVVAFGPANIGKSTLLNALAGRGVSIVADEPGTTRDHVGIHLDLAGLIVRYIDTPGMHPASDPIELEARALSLTAAAAADLLLLLGDAHSLPPPPPPSFRGAVIRVALRTDLGIASWPSNVQVCAPRSEGLEALAGLIRESLVPKVALDDPQPWHFWKNAARSP